MFFVQKMFSLDEPLKFFRIYLWYIYSNVYNWKSLAYSIYHIEHLIHHFDNYQIKNLLEKQYRNLSDYFTLFMKDLITIEIQSSKRLCHQYSHSYPRSDSKDIENDSIFHA